MYLQVQSTYMLVLLLLGYLFSRKLNHLTPYIFSWFLSLIADQYKLYMRSMMYIAC